MPTSTAISAQGSGFYVAGTPGIAVAVTGITKATSAVVTAANSLAVGDAVDFGVVTSMPEIFGLLGVVTVASASSFTVNIDSSAFATAGTAGTATPQTWTEVGNVKDYTGFDGTVSQLEKTNMRSGAKEFSPGLQDFGNFGFNCDVDNADAGQLALKAQKSTAAIKPFKVVLPNGKLRVFKQFVTKFSEAGGVDAILKSSVSLRITGIVNFA